MHSETFSVCATACAVGCAAPGPPPGRSFLQLAWAALKAGEDGLIPELSWMPPPGLGSGKFGTACERMHSLKVRKAERCAESAVPFEDPQAASAPAHVMAASVTSGRWRSLRTRVQ